MEQPELGVSRVGVDSITVSLSWAWDTGWVLHGSTRLSGSTVWRPAAARGLDAAEAHAAVSDLLANALGLT